MFVGHALAAFALVAVVARRLGERPARALTFGAVAGAFAAAPDVDIGYALVGVAAGASGGAGPLGLAESFWSTGNVVHRAVTHSLVVAPVVAAVAAAWVHGRADARAIALGLAAGLVAVVAAVGGPLAALVTLAFVATALALAAAVRSRTELSARATFALALVGLVSHPFGDVFTGEPPALLYPVAAEVLSARVALSADPTLHLLGAFAIELATIWAAAIVWIRLRAQRDGRLAAADRAGRVAAPAWLRDRLDPRALAGAGYAASAFVIPAPTLELSYPFVFSVLAVGAVAVVPIRIRRLGRWRERGRAALAPELSAPGTERAVVTALTAVSLAAGAYLVAYLAGVP
ncbi:metal-dependent hydrolase [Halobaculum gomorrense]|uniref:LexA-binding, inner membrane-associated putative hydrolase n=1 Tax=Halobaculum gomorrense TaxID=43928 RepID=A0A1M5S2B4_9EURY|nr:metal-dependent hydrolase [Halobaculum gomorrense]SHH32609.1 LexA-binding, inner membrane-associated putative hydrolase [Halobaculum gomorrense]